MAKQEVFNKVARHLLTQRVQSKKENDCTCLYRGPNGTMCAAGVFLKDEVLEEYGWDIEGWKLGWEFNHPDNNNDVDGIAKLFTLSGVPEEVLPFLAGFQTVHDSYPPYEWKALLKRKAITYDLDYSVLDDFE